MTKYLWRFLLCTNSLLVMFVSSGYGQSVCSQNNFVSLEQVDFRYIIYEKSCDDFGNPEAGIRRIDLLLQEKAFSEENLKKLFAVLSEGYPEPQLLLIQVITNLEQARPEGFPQISGGKDNPAAYIYHRASYQRDKNNEFFRYNPNPPDRQMKTIVLRGKDPSGAPN